MVVAEVEVVVEDEVAVVEVEADDMVVEVVTEVPELTAMVVEVVVEDTVVRGGKPTLITRLCLLTRRFGHRLDSGSTSQSLLRQDFLCTYHYHLDFIPLYRASAKDRCI